MSQRLDLVVDGVLRNTNQLSTNQAFQRRVVNAMQTAAKIEIRRHTVAPVPAPPPPTTPPSSSLARLAQRIVFCAWNPQTALNAPPGMTIAPTADIHVECSSDDDKTTRERKAAAYVAKAVDAAKQWHDRGGLVAAWGVQTQIGAQAIRDFGATINADFLIYQAETADEYATAIEAGAQVIVGNSNAWTEPADAPVGHRPGERQRSDATRRIRAGELAFAFETYTNDGAPWPEASTSSGVPAASFVIGVYPSKWDPRVADYRAHTPSEAWPNVSVYHAAALTDDDWRALT